MKTGFVMCSILVLGMLTNCSVSSTKPDNFQLQIEKFNKENVRGKDYWLLKCILKNNNKDTLSYLSMSCSWTEFYVVTIKGLEIDGFSCDKNIPTILSLLPGESRSEILRLFKGKDFNNTSSKFLKVGLNLNKDIIKRKDFLNLSYTVDFDNLDK